MRADGRQEYVVGFLFDEAREFVVLVRKNRPEWQKNMLNGAGGSVEEGETFHAAMQREFREEAGMDIPEKDWNVVATLLGNGYIVQFFWATGDVDAVQSLTDEQVGAYWIEESLSSDMVLPNLKWIIPMCFDNTLLPVMVMEKGTQNSV